MKTCGRLLRNSSMAYQTTMINMSAYVLWKVTKKFIRVMGVNTIMIVS